MAGSISNVLGRARATQRRVAGTRIQHVAAENEYRLGLEDTVNFKA